MSGLIRTRIGRFRLEQAVDSEQLTGEHLRLHLQPSQTITAGLPQFRVSPDDRRRLERGQALSLVTAGVSNACSTSHDAAPCRADAADAVSPSAGSARFALTDAETGELLGLAGLSVCGRQLLPKLVLIRPSHNP